MAKLRDIKTLKPKGQTPTQGKQIPKPNKTTQRVCQQGECSTGYYSELVRQYHQMDGTKLTIVVLQLNNMTKSTGRKARNVYVSFS